MSTTTPAAKPDLKVAPAPKPAAPKGRKPAAPKQPTVSLGLSQTPTWRPVVTMPGGRKLTCPHQKYGHESEAAAKKCSRTLIAQA